MKHLGRKVISTVLVCVLLLSVCVLPVSAENAIGTTIYGNTTDDLCFYERVVEMTNGDLLATWCREFPVVTNWTGMKTYYFYKSSDNGLTWTQISTLDPSSYGDLSRDKMGMHGLYVFPQSDFRNPCPFQHPLQHIIHAVRGDWATVGTGKHIFVVGFGFLCF